MVVGYSLCTAGVSASHALDGKDGKCGEDGRDGRGGEDATTPSSYPMNHRGGDGTNGTDGHDSRHGGHNATNGTDAAPIHVHIAVETPTPLTLLVSGSHNAHVVLPPASHLLLDARGGNGGHGGRGGDGGAGGCGGSGGSGGCGPPGRDASEYGQSGGDAGTGGSGGSGGDGGDGGNGSNGGHGGNGGNGANITVTVIEPRVIAALAMSCEGGQGGEGGREGHAGPAGPAGAAGPGGPGGRGGAAVEKPSSPYNSCPYDCGVGNAHMVCPFCHKGICTSCGGGTSSGNTCKCGKNFYASQGSDGRTGTAGSSGRSGKSGHQGRCGIAGKRGYNGMNGVAMIQVIDIKGNVIEQSHEPYGAQVLSFVLRDENEDGVYEPGTHVLITQVQVYNPGGLTLPEGAVLSVFGTNPNVLVMPMQGSVVLPAIPPKQTVTIDSPLLVLMVADLPIAPFGPTVAQGSLSSVITLWGYEFAGSRHQQQFTIQYPVCLKDLMPPSNCSPNAPVLCTLSALNISQKCIEEPVVVSFGLPVGFSSNVSSLNYSPLQPNAKTPLQYSLVASSEVELFAEVPYTFTLFLRGKPIENGSAVLRVCPIYNPAAPPLDALFITGPHVPKSEYDIWKYAFSLMNISFDIWDASAMGGVSFDSNGQRHPATWAGRYKDKLIVWVLPANDALKMLALDDLLGHFGWAGHNAAVQHPSKSGFLMLNASSVALDFWLFNCPQATKFEADAKQFSGFHLPLLEPSTYSAEKTADKLTKSYEQKDKKFRYLVTPTDIKPQKVSLVKWEYGSASVSKMPLPKGTHFLNVEAFDLAPKKTVKDLGSLALPNKYATIIAGILFALPFTKKLEVFKASLNKNDARFAKLVFVDVAKPFTFSDLVAEAIYHDLKKEYWSCDAEEFPRLTEFSQSWDKNNDTAASYYSLLVRLNNASPASKEDSWAKLPGFFYKKQSVQLKNFEKAKTCFQSGLNSSVNSAASEKAKNRLRAKKLFGGYAFPTDMPSKSAKDKRSQETSAMFWESETGQLVTNGKKLVAGLL